jgi:hypothetical protein
MPIPRSSFLPHHFLHMYDMGSPTGLAKAVAAFCGGSNSTGRKNLQMVGFRPFLARFGQRMLRLHF